MCTDCQVTPLASVSRLPGDTTGKSAERLSWVTPQVSLCTNYYVMPHVSLPSNCLLDPTVPSNGLLGNTTGESILQKSTGRLTSGVARQTVAGQSHLWCYQADSHRADSPLVLPGRQSQGRVMNMRADCQVTPLASLCTDCQVAPQVSLHCLPVDSTGESVHRLPGNTTSESVSWVIPQVSLYIDC